MNDKRVEIKRITGPVLIELRRNMIEHPDKTDEFIGILLGEIDRIKDNERKQQTWKRLNHLQTLVGQHSMKITYLKSQMSKMIRGYEKKINKLEENTPIIDGETK